MRYRRLSYRYALGLVSDELRPLGELWRTERIGVQLAQTSWRPAADVYETADELRVTVELAGVQPEELEVLLNESAVIIEGRRRLPPAEEDGVYHAAEIRRGPFRLVLTLPTPIDPDRAVANSDGGLLQMTFPKADGR
jgi:HSP20 family protein